MLGLVGVRERRRGRDIASDGCGGGTCWCDGAGALRGRLYFCFPSVLARGWMWTWLLSSEDVVAVTVFAICYLSVSLLALHDSVDFR